MKLHERCRLTTFVEQGSAEAAGYTASQKDIMHKFTYRTPRYAVDFPVQLMRDDAVVAGRCREISTEGMRLELRRQLPAGFSGTVMLAWRDVHVELRVKLAHSGAGQDALRFVFDSESERAAIADLVARLADPAEPASEPGLVLVR